MPNRLDMYTVVKRMQGTTGLTTTERLDSISEIMRTKEVTGLIQIKQIRFIWDDEENTRNDFSNP